MDKAKPGHTVEFKGFQGATHLNGTKGTLLLFLKEEQRWSVRCDVDNLKVKAKPENLLLHCRATDGGGIDAINEAVLSSFHEHKKGGAIVSCGNTLMLAVEFFGPYGNGGANCEMVYVDKNPQAQAVLQGRGCASARELGEAFLAGETIEYVETTDENLFKALLSKYRCGSSTKHLIDIKSGLKIYEVNVSP